LRRLAFYLLIAISLGSQQCPADEARDVEFYETRIRPLLVRHCYECHSEQAKKSEGGLLLDRRSGWLEGGDTGKAVLPGEPSESLLIQAVRRSEDIQMPPEKTLSEKQVSLLVNWVRRGAPGPKKDLGETTFSQLGDQEYLAQQSKQHWAFLPVGKFDPPVATESDWNVSPVDQYVHKSLVANGLAPSRPTSDRNLVRRLYYDLTGLPPSIEDVEQFVKSAAKDRKTAVERLVDRLIESPAFGEHFGRMWLDVARYADTDSFYRPDTRTPHYFPYAFTYRDYVIQAFNGDKPFDLFIKEQLAADLLETEGEEKELRALGFLTVGPYANRDPLESLDEWIDATTRGFMGLTAACARCHDHKYEPIPTADYYSLRGIFASVIRVDGLNEKLQPLVEGYDPSKEEVASYEKKRAAIDAKIDSSAGKTSKNNNKSVGTKIRQTELAELLLFHSGAPARTMVVVERKKPVVQRIYHRGDASSPGDVVPRRFLKVLDQKQTPFPEDTSGRLQLAERIADPNNPLTARVYVNRVWGYVMGSHLVKTPSNFGLQGSTPTHPELLDWLARDFVENGWSTKRLVRQIVTSQTYQQSSDERADMSAKDLENRLLWRANRKRLSIEAIRDSFLVVAQQLDSRQHGRSSKLWGKQYSRRRTVYGYINRFNLDPTLRAFDFPTPMQTQPTRDESIVAPQALFTLNSPFVVDQAKAIVSSEAFKKCDSDEARIDRVYAAVYQRAVTAEERSGIESFLAVQVDGKSEASTSTATSPATWQLFTQALLMSNEFQYVD
jgi:hypothetical protein